MKCPACKKKLTPNQMLKLTNWFAKRLMTPCVGCTKMLILYKVSWRIVNLISLALLIGFMMLENNFLDFVVFTISTMQLLSFVAIFFIIYIFYGLPIKLAKL